MLATLETVVIQDENLHYIRRKIVTQKETLLVTTVLASSVTY